MASFNRVVLLGNLTRDPEIRQTGTGTTVANVGLAVNERIKRGDEWVDEPNFFDLVLFGRKAELAGEYLSKGSQALFEGRLRFEQWEKDGQKRSKVSVIVDNMQFVGSRGDSQQGQRQSQPRAQRQEMEAIPEDSIPF
jgi:single-strand DNA-binding protein